MALLVTHVGEGGIVGMVTHGREDGIVSDTRREGWYCY
jgi:hypothetical protein